MPDTIPDWVKWAVVAIVVIFVLKVMDENHQQHCTDYQLEDC